MTGVDQHTGPSTNSNAIHLVTDTKSIRNSIWIGLGLETLEQLEIQYRKAEATQCLARSTHVHSVPATRIALLRLLSRYYSLYKNINSTTTLVHRTMGTHWKWFHRDVRRNLSKVRSKKTHDFFKRFFQGFALSVLNRLCWTLPLVFTAHNSNL